MSIDERFLAKVEITASCWQWAGAVQSRGYGSFNGRLAHRWAYERWVGPIPAGMTIDHLCRNKRCVKVAHLEVVTRAENNRRKHQEQTHCKNGHPLWGDNIRMRGNRRVCRSCKRDQQREFMRQQRALAKNTREVA